MSHFLLRWHGIVGEPAFTPALRRLPWSLRLVVAFMVWCVFATSSVSAQLTVTKGVAIAPPSGVCDDRLTYGPTAQGVDDCSCTNFCYKIVVSNDGAEPLSGGTIDDPDLPGLTIPWDLDPYGPSTVNFASKTWCAADAPPPNGHVNTVIVSAWGLFSGTLVSASASATVVVPCPLALGEACTSGSQCASTFCASGVCCDVPCTEPNQSCNLPGTIGLCRPLGGEVPAASQATIIALSVLLAAVGIGSLISLRHHRHS